MGIPTVYEVDDLIFDPTAFPDPLETYGDAITAQEHFELRAGVALVRHAASSCDAGIARTRELGCSSSWRGSLRGGPGLPQWTLKVVNRCRAGFNPATSSRTRNCTRHHVLRKWHACAWRDFRNLLLPALTRMMADTRRSASSSADTFLRRIFPPVFLVG